MFIVGLTGGISTGKTTVSSVFAEHGVPVIDADKIAREVVEPGSDTLKRINDVFGDEVILASGELNRDRLGEIIFDDVSKRRKLNELTHPEIQSRIRWRILQCFFEGHPFIIVDLPLLFETGSLVNYVYKIIVVSCEPKQQLERLMKRNAMPKNLAEKRIAAQMPLDEKCALAHFIIDNSGSIENTREQALRLVNLLKQSKHHWRIRGAMVFCFIAAVFPLLYIFIRFYL